MRYLLRRFLRNSYHNNAKRRSLSLRCHHIINFDNWEGRLETFNNELENSLLKLRHNLQGGIGMIYCSIIPENFVPSFDCVRGLEKEYQRLMAKVSVALDVYDFYCACFWFNWANLVQNASKEAWQAINKNYNKQFDNGD